jgi:hypothetical protein
MSGFLFEMLGELLLQIILQALAEMGSRSLVEPFRKTPNVWLATIGYGLLGSGFGALSL